VGDEEHRAGHGHRETGQATDREPVAEINDVGLAVLAVLPVSAESRGKLVEQARRKAAEYAQGERRPLGAYSGGMTIYSGVVLGLGALARRQRRTLPTPSPFEVLLVTAATHKLARLVSKESITSALRAPFTRYRGWPVPRSCPRMCATMMVGCG
jgi:hypothetical protein